MVTLIWAKLPANIYVWKSFNKGSFYIGVYTGKDKVLDYLFAWTSFVVVGRTSSSARWLHPARFTHTRTSSSIENQVE